MHVSEHCAKAVKSNSVVDFLLKSIYLFNKVFVDKIINKINTSIKNRLLVCWTGLYQLTAYLNLNKY